MPIDFMTRFTQNGGFLKTGRIFPLTTLIFLIFLWSSAGAADDSESTLYQVRSSQSNGYSYPYQYKLSNRWLEDPQFTRWFAYGGSYYLDGFTPRTSPATLSVREGYLSGRTSDVEAFSLSDINYFVYDQRNGESFTEVPALEVTNGYASLSYHVTGGKNDYFITYLTPEETPNSLVCFITLKVPAGNDGADYIDDYKALTASLKLGHDEESA